MSGSTDRKDALRLLQGLEDGGMSAFEAQRLAEDLDPVLVYLIVRYLREIYPASNRLANAVLDRVVALTSAWPGLVAKSKEGEQDPISTWFISSHAFGEFRGRGPSLIETIVDKLES